MPPIVLLTDFGGKDWFAGVLRGVIAGIAPRASVIDLTHGIPAGDIRAGAFNLWAAFRHFPEGSVFVAVVDPGVGGPRAPLLVSAHGRRFLGPDNGLLSWASAGDPGRTLRVLSSPEYRLPEVGSTFHGRDIFAPAAAHLSAGARPAALGKAAAGMVELPPIACRTRREGLAGEIVHIDGFGNAVTSVSGADLRGLPEGTRKAVANGRTFPLKAFYAEAARGGALCLVGSTGLVELSVNGGDAARTFRLRRGGKVLVR